MPNGCCSDGGGSGHCQVAGGSGLDGQGRCGVAVFRQTTKPEISNRASRPKPAAAALAVLFYSSRIE
ncbi:hypothetical protein SBC1_07430 [Caballeronia sp. SBC1]|nr:hypothetical protein SBC2_07490 [Caballeronia sp. SBC2]QIN60766.1 hypothetical protein SBC1_07430 [Caballeronia sp. SBC1]